MKAGSTYISLWFGVFYTLFFIADTVTNVPYLALGPELSTNSKERENLYLYFYIFQYIGVLFAAAAPVILNRFYPVKFFIIYCFLHYFSYISKLAM